MKKESKIAICSANGLGDALLGFQYADFLRSLNISPAVFCAVRPEIFEVLSYLLPTYNPLKIDEEVGANNNIFKWLNTNKNHKDIKQLSLFDTIYYDVPDLLGRGPLNFPFEQYNTRLELIKERRLLTKWNISSADSIIYVSLVTSTQGYSDPILGRTIIHLCKQFPQYTFYCPLISSWNNQNTIQPKFDEYPENLVVAENKSFIENLEVLRRSKFAIVNDSGALHTIYHTGKDFIFLNPRYTIQSVAWLPRWYNPTILHNAVPLAPNISDFDQRIEAILRFKLEMLTINLPAKIIFDYPFDISAWQANLYLKY